MWLYASRMIHTNVKLPILRRSWQTGLVVLCEAEETGSAYNLATGFYALVSTALSGIASARNADDWLIVPGADVETDDELKARCRNQFSAVNRWNIDAVYKALGVE